MASARYALFNFWPFLFANNQGFGNFTLNQSNDKIAWVSRPENTEAITHIAYRLASLTGTPTFRLSIQGVDGSGNDDGVIKGGGTPASVTFQPSALGHTAGNYYFVALDNSYTPSLSEQLAFVLDHPGTGTTPDGANNAGISYSQLMCTPRYSHYPILYDGGVRSKPGEFGIFAYKTASAVYGVPVESTFQTNFDLNTSPDEYALKYRFPGEWGDTYKPRGIRLPLAFDAGGTTKFQIYGGTDTTPANCTGATTEITVHATRTHDHDHGINPGGFGSYDILFDSRPTLYYNAWYRIGIQPQGTQDVYIFRALVDAAADLAAWPLGQDCYVSTRSDGGNWTDDTIGRIKMMLLLDDITEPAGGGTQGGPLVGPGRLARAA